MNKYGKGRSVYLSGMENPNVDVYYYPKVNRYALINLSGKEVEETYYDMQGKRQKATLAANAIQWIEG